MVSETRPRFMNWCVSLVKETVVGQIAPVREGAGGYADWLMLEVLYIKVKRGETHRSAISVLRHIPRIHDILDLYPHKERRILSIRRRQCFRPPTGEMPADI